MLPQPWTQTDSKVILRTPQMFAQARFQARCQKTRAGAPPVSARRPRPRARRDIGVDGEGFMLLGSSTTPKNVLI